jgi:hypothetical protein
MKYNEIKRKLQETFDTKEWKRYRNFNVYISLFGLPERMIVRPSSFGYEKNMNPLAFRCFKVNRTMDLDIISTEIESAASKY